MLRIATCAIVTALVLASACPAAIVDPVFIRGNLRNPLDTDSDAYDSLTAFNSAADMAAYRNGWWNRPMSSNQWGTQRWKFFDGTNYYRVQRSEYQDPSPWLLHSYGSSLWNLMNDSVVSTQQFAAPPAGAYAEDWTDGGYFFSAINFFADTDGSVYQVWFTGYNVGMFTDRVTRFASVSDLLAGSGTTYPIQYRWGDAFMGVNGRFYRTNINFDPDSMSLHRGQVFGVAEYNSFADLVSGNSSAVYGDGTGLAWDLFMAVPRAAVISVPEPSSWVMGAVGTACAGWAAFRRPKRTAAVTAARSIPRRRD